MEKATGNEAAEVICAAAIKPHMFVSIN